ncbi:hypothetical protein Taro_020856 [Colocasia esculenta]|uniref:Uncharacterized protein n=1 Tax=Colocasia esculenta TaxID=4460 RepID=A0A843V3M6_COLES|nr:hypothetical protein [Colocasia esculenta]
MLPAAALTHFFCLPFAKGFSSRNPPALFGAVLLLSSSSSPSGSSRPKWNSSNLVITNPVLCAMENCSSMRELRQIQGHMTRTGLMAHRFPGSRVLAFCALADAGDLNHAQRVFAHMSETNTYMWNTMLRGYSRWGRPISAFSLFRRMIREGVEMDNRTVLFALKTCELLFPRALDGEGVHCLINKLGFELDLLVRNGLMHFYMSYGLLDCAQDVFYRCSEVDVVSWTTMIDGFTQRGLAAQAIIFFHSMLSRGVQPNEVTMITVLSACSQLGLSDLGRSVHGCIEKHNVIMSINLHNALVDMYGKCGLIDSAREVFDKMGTRDVFSWTSVVNGYAKCGNLELARQFFNEMTERNVISWSTMIAGYSQANRANEALDLFHEMLATDVDPIDATLVSVLSACAQSGRLDIGKWIHLYLIFDKRIKLTTVLANALMDMYAKSGAICEASDVFVQIPEKDIVSWNSMILAYAVHGYSKEALSLFEKMKNVGVVPDNITFIGVLSACSHGGLVMQGQKYFADMKMLFGLEPRTEHYACMIDLLGRVGLLEDAAQLIESMPGQPDKAAWGALLNACMIHQNVELGKLAGEKLLALDPGDSGVYALLSNLYAARKRWHDVKMVRRTMRECGVKKTPGCSSIEVDGKFHEFFAGDKSHSLSEEIYKILGLMYAQLCLEDCLDFG